MKLRVSLLVALSHLLCSAVEAAHPKVLMSEDSTTGFIVVLKEADADISSIQAKADALTAGNPSITVTKIFDLALTGFAADMTTEEAEAMADSDAVAYIEQNGMVYPSQGATWGLDRIDQRDLPLNGVYNAPGNGEGVTAYVIDTGINKSHEEFDNGRASYGINLTGDNRDEDCNGHGTHVAGTIAGKVYGVANKAKVIAIKVFSCSGGASYATVIEGVNWAMTHAEDNDTIATSNLSLGGGKSTAMNDAVNNMQDAGIVTVVAAGNSNADACNYSPASAEKVISVASSTSTDARSSFSNYGTCVEIFAPGSSIKSAWWNGNTAYNTISGTSMASPHVCGAAALLLGDGMDPADVWGRLKENATPDKISNPGSGTPNELLFVEMAAPTVSPAPTITASSTPTVTPTPKPTSYCVDSKSLIDINGKRRKCKWVRKFKKSMCKKDKVRQLCPDTCEACGDYGCHDLDVPFYLYKEGPQMLTCEDVADLDDKEKEEKCSKPKIKTTCRDTCVCSKGGDELFIDFDEVTDGSAKEYFRDEIKLENFYSYNGKQNRPGSGYDNGTISPPIVAFNGFARPMTMSCPGGSFSIKSVYMTPAFNNGNRVTMDGYLNGSKVSTYVAVTSRTDDPKFFDSELDVLGEVDRLVMTTSASQVVWDNLTIEIINPCSFNNQETIDDDDAGDPSA